MDTSDGTASRVHDSNQVFAGDLESLAFFDGALYSVNFSFRYLATVNINDGTSSRVHASNTFESGHWRALGAYNETLYAINDRNYALYTVNTTDGTASRVHSSNTLGAGNWESLASAAGALSTVKGFYIDNGRLILWRRSNTPDDKINFNLLGGASNYNIAEIVGIK